VDVIHRTTLKFLQSVNTPDFPEPTWKHNPSMAAVASVPFRYWKAPADWSAGGAGPVEMTTGEKATVDGNLLTASRDATVAQRVDNVEDALRAVVLVVRDELNLHADKINAILTAIDNNSTLANIRTAIAGIADYPQRTVQQLRDAVRNKLGT
jgi:hypothetical protein